MTKRKKTKRDPEFHQGDAAGKKFEQAMKALFSAPKLGSKKPNKGKD